MIENFAEKPAIKIPDILKPYVMTIVHGSSERTINVEYPMFATGFPVIIHITESLPMIKKNGISTKPSSNLCLGGQIYNAEISLKYDGILEALGIILHPLTPYYLFHLYPDQMLNKWYPFNQLQNIETSRIYNDLKNISDLNKRVDSIFSFLIDLVPKRLPPIPWIDQSILKLLQNNGAIEISHLYDDKSLSERHYRRMFKKFIGMPPKYYAKVIQLGSVFRMINEQDSDSLHILALDCGYYDQAHFINDFKKSLGQSPTKFFKSDHAFLSSYLGVQ